MNEDEEFLAHFGVKGMKWGVRKDRRSSGKIEARKTSPKSGWEFEGNRGTLSAQKKYSKAEVAKLQRQVDGLRLEKQLDEQLLELRPKTAQDYIRDETVKFVADLVAELGKTASREASKAISGAVRNWIRGA